MTWASFKEWYMELYWQFDNLFLVSAKFLGITYHEFVLISLVIVWPLITLVMLLAIVKLCRDRRQLARSIAVSTAALMLVVFSLDRQAYAGPSAIDMDYKNLTRPLKVISKVSNGIRFDIIIPQKPNFKYQRWAGFVMVRR